ncbi:MAG: DUF58 domain-containing protein [Planctomycetes bacterium]|nr:DUF58 domain-containing protein [Planctomycetota bacterium]
MPESRKSSDPRKYLDPKVLSRIGRLEVKARLIVEGFISGLHKSPYHGFSVEFAEHREYVPGDDIRHVDWKVFGRSDRYYIKQYEEETNLRAYLLLDVSRSMAYPDPPRPAGPDHPATKFEYGAYVAAGLSHLLLRQQDAVGLALFDDRVRTFVTPSSSPSHIQTILGEIEGSALREKTDLGSIFHELADRVKKKGLIVIVSDLFDDIERIQRGLRHLRFKGHDVIVFQVLDRDELTFPFRRTTLFEGLEGHPELLANPQSLRDAYLEELNAFLGEVRKVCRDSRIDYVRLDSLEPLDVALSAYLAKRAGALRSS